MEIPWSTLLTKLPTFDVGLYLSLYVILDLFSRFPVGWIVSRKENASLSVQLFRKTIRRREVNPELFINQEHGSPMIAYHSNDFVISLGPTLSQSRPRVSNDNPFREAKFKTLKYAPSYPGCFDDCPDARASVAKFIDHYVVIPHSSLAMFTPAAAYFGRIDTLHRVRQAALNCYCPAHPERLVRSALLSPRPPQNVRINPVDDRGAKCVLAENDALADDIDSLVVGRVCSLISRAEVFARS
jgi:putative transposase